MLASGGAKASIEHFHFPATAFHELGSAQQPGTFLGVLESLETAFTDAYTVAVGQLLQLRHPDLAQLAAQIMGVEAEHRVLGRVIGGALPANDITLERVPFACGLDAGDCHIQQVLGDVREMHPAVAAGTCLAILATGYANVRGGYRVGHITPQVPQRDRILD